MKKKSLSTDKKVVTFGEVMLRLTTPGFRRFSQTNEFIATYGGSEANVAVSLAHFGIPTEFVTRLPDNAVSRACINSLRASGLGTDGIVFASHPELRLSVSIGGVCNVQPLTEAIRQADARMYCNKENGEPVL